MKEQVIVKAEPRAKSGSSAVSQLRRDGWLPGIVYGEGKPGTSIQIREQDFLKMLGRHRSEHMILDLEIRDSGMRKVLIREVQHDPLTSRLRHVDFYEVSMTRKLRVDIPIVLTGEPVGVTQGGGLLDHLLRTVEIECLPGDLIEQIVVDVSGLELGKHLCVRDIHLDPSKYAILTAPELAIAAVSTPRAEEEVAPVAEGATPAAGAEPEVITKKKEETEVGAKA
ncbi:MAG: 50S ribosomal protein L25 [Kiritimatiellia bacterium]|nr:50S ribosomal protein L25 [Kiritimatiellia bacterium]